MTEKDFVKIVERVAEIIKGTSFENHVFCVGGCVRDQIMGNPIKDIDMCVDIENGGIAFANFMRDNGHTNGSVVTYPTYGTAMFRLAEFPDKEIEVVQTRGEQYHDKDSRNPVTTFALIEDDCIRRDLTINALYRNVSTGEVLDLTGKGIQDIEDGVCRVTNNDPDVVFIDDPLRILRVIRFACRYNFQIERFTFDAMVRNSSRLEIISQERITDEFNKMLTTDNPVRALNLLRDTDAMKYVIPELEETYDMGQNAYHFGTVWEHTLKVVENAANDGSVAYLPVRLACVLHDIGKIKTRTVGEDGRVHFYEHEFVGAKLAAEIMSRMRYSNDIIEEVCFYIKNHMRTKNWGNDFKAKARKMKSIRKLAYDCKTAARMYRLLQVIDADNNAHAPQHCIPNQADRLADLMVSDESVKRMFGYKLPINGNDVMEVKGIEAGPEVKKYLDHCLKLAFNNPNITKEECVKDIKKLKINV